MCMEHELQYQLPSCIERLLNMSEELVDQIVTVFSKPTQPVGMVAIDGL